MRPKPPYFVQCQSGLFVIANEAETIQSHLLRHGEFEPLAARLALAVAAHRTGMVVDVGANIGTFSVPFALQRAATRLLAFEPQRPAFLHLCANLFLNRLINVEPFNVAVGSTAGMIDVPLFDPFVERYTGSVTLDPAIAAIRSAIPGVAEPASYASRHVRTPVVTLDDVIGTDPVAFIKIDVEGMESDVLRGASGLLSRQRPMIYAEAWDLPQFAAHKQLLHAQFEAAGYRLREFGDDFIALPRESGDEVDSIIERARGRQ